MTAHEHLASITAIYLTIFYLSGGVGAAIGGSIWVNMIPEKLHAYITDQTVANSAYGDPFSFADAYGPETPERKAVGRAYTETQVRFDFPFSPSLCFASLLTGRCFLWLISM